MGFHQMVPQPKMLIIVMLYFVAILVLVVFNKKGKNYDNIKDFALAGKGLGSFVLMSTFLASWMGGGVVTGSVTSIAYNNGLFPTVCYGSCTLLGIIFLFSISPIVRKRGEVTTAALVQECYGKNSRILSGAIIALASFAVASYQMKALGIVLNATTGISIRLCTYIACAIFILVCIRGGLGSVTKIDVFSVLLMLVGLGTGFIFIMNKLGGVSWILARTHEVAPQGLTFTTGWTAKDYLAMYLPGFLLCLGDQNLYQRIAAAKDDKNIRTGMVGWAIGILIIMPLVSCFGYIGRLYFGTNIVAGQATISLSTICPWYIGGLMMAACCAFIITTGDSYLLAGSTNISTDIYNQLKKGADDKQVLKVTRIAMVVCGVLSLGILNFFPSILSIQLWANTITGAGIAPSLLGAVIFPDKVSKAGGIASMSIGTGLTILGEVLGQPFGLATVLVAFPVSALTLIIVSAFTKKPMGRLVASEQ